MVPAAASQQGTTRHIGKNHMQLRRLEPLSENCAVPCLNAQKKRTSKDVLFFMPDTAGRRQICPDPDGLCPSSATRDTTFPPTSTFPNGDRQPATRPPPFPSLPSFKIKVFGKDGGMQGGKGNLFSKRFPFPPANKQQTIPAYTLKKRSRSALLTTEKDDKAMAVPAIMGESMGPPKTCSSPAATGRPSRL